MTYPKGRGRPPGPRPGTTMASVCRRRMNRSLRGILATAASICPGRSRMLRSSAPRSWRHPDPRQAFRQMSSERRGGSRHLPVVADFRPAVRSAHRRIPALPRTADEAGGQLRSELWMSATVAFVGLGNIGGRVVAHLVKTGRDVVVFDLNTAAVQTAVEAGARSAASAAAAAEGAEAVFLSLPTPAIVE